MVTQNTLSLPGSTSHISGGLCLLLHRNEEHRTFRNVGAHSVMWNIERTKVVKAVYQEKVRFELTCVETGVRGGDG